MIAIPRAKRKRVGSAVLISLLVLVCAVAGLLIPNLFELSPKTQNLYGLLLIAAMYGVALFIDPKAALWVGMIIVTIFISFTGFQYEVKAGSSLRVSALDCFVGSFALILWVLPKGQSREWGRTEPGVRKAIWRFLIFLPIGVVVAITRGVEPISILAMTKLFYYPMLMAFVLPRVVNTRRRLEIILGLAIALAVYSAFNSRVQGPPLDQPLQGPSTVGLERAYGQWGTSNPFANYLLFALLVPAAFAMKPRQPARALVMAVAAAVAGWGLLGTFTRGAWLGAGVGLVFLTVSDKLGKVLLTLVVAVVVAAIVPTAVHERAVDIEDSSTRRRLDLWKTGYEATLAYPVTGAGWGSSFYLMGHTLVKSTGVPWWHNDYLVVSSQIGVVGLGAFVAMWFSIVGAGLRAGRATADTFYRPLILGLTASIVGAMVHAVFEHVFWRFETAPHTWFLVACLMSAILLSRESGTEASRS